MFGGEAFLQAALPDYEGERLRVQMLLIVAVIFWMLVFPVLASTLPPPPPTAKQTATTTKSTTKTTTHRSKASKISTKTSVRTIATLAETPSTQPETPTISMATSLYSVLGLVVSVFGILMMLSPHNYYVPRRVFQAPLLSAEECQHVMDMAQAAAQRNYESALAMTKDPENEFPSGGDADADDDSTTETRTNALLKEPKGWQKTRHRSYPTTDLNLVTDPFTRADRDWLGSVLDRRLAPTLARVYGVPASSIRANDMFVVRYDAKHGQPYLRNHTDDSDISFNILLNEDFEGGGTRFWDRVHQEAFAHVTPTRRGQVLMHSALIHHEGYHITAGTRMILVGFLSVDRVDPFHADQSTGLSTLASWGCWSWLHTRFKHAYNIRLDRLAKEQQQTQLDTPVSGSQWMNQSPYLRRLLLDLVAVLQTTGDVLATHAVENLVAVEHAEQYRNSLDKAFDGKQPRAVWWHGQQITIDVDGSIASEWDSRSSNSQAFDEL